MRTRWTITKAHARRLWSLNRDGLRLWWRTIRADYWRDGT